MALCGKNRGASCRCNCYAVGGGSVIKNLGIVEYIRIPVSVDKLKSDVILLPLAHEIALGIYVEMAGRGGGCGRYEWGLGQLLGREFFQARV